MALIGICAVLVLVVYAPAINGGYIWDDDSYVTNNPLVKAADGLWGIWFQPRRSPQYYPLVFSSFWLEYRLWGLRPFGYHLVNVLLHLLNAFLVWRICRRLSITSAWLVAAIFLLHPVHVETVAWITERKNVLSAALYLGAAFTYLQFMGCEPGENATRQRWRTYAIALALFSGALLSKSVTASLPAALLLVVWWKRGRIVRGDIAPLVPMFLVGAMFGLHTAYLEKVHVGAHGAAWDFTVLERFLIAGRVFWFYAAKLLWPDPLIFFYPRWHIDTARVWEYFYPLGVVLVLGLLWILRRRMGRGPVTAVLFFIGTLVPVSGFMNVYPMRFSFVADHFQYLASLGLIVLFSGALARIVTKYARRQGETVLRASGVGLLLILGLLTQRQSVIYTSEETLWRRTIALNDRAFLAYYNLGVILEKRGENGQAIVAYENTLRADPEYVKAYNNLGILYSLQGDFPAARKNFKAALQIDPEYARAYFNYATLLGNLGQTAEAENYFKQAIRCDPDYEKAYNSLGALLGRQGRAVEAASYFERARALGDDHR